MDQERTHLTLSELAGLIQSALMSELGGDLWVIAEIGKITDRKHVYIELVEKDETGYHLASMQAVIWASRRNRILGKFELLTGQTLEVGQKVLIYGHVEYHSVYGLKFHIEDIDPSYTLGEAQLNKLKIIAYLKKHGLLELNKSLHPPRVIQRIAIISSKTAAGYEDFVNQLKTIKYNVSFRYELFAAYMQGENTTASILSALDQIRRRYKQFDVVVIVRGGGSSSDLSYFDDQVLAESIARFPLPVLTGIGHTRDLSVVDMVAYANFKTPTAAADFIVKRAEGFISEMLDARLRLSTVVKQYLASERLVLEKLHTQLRMAVANYLLQHKYKLQNLSKQYRQITDLLRQQEIQLHLFKQRLASGYRILLQNQRAELKQLTERLKQQSSNQLQKNRVLLEKLQIIIEQNQIQKILEKGFSLTLVNGHVVSSVHQLSLGERIETWLKDGKISSVIEQISVEKSKKQEQ